MYQRYYNLDDRPFELTPNPRYLFLAPQHREALSNLEYGLSAAKSLTLLIGDPGTGKTTLLRAALESERCRGVQCIYLNNPALTRDEFVYVLASRFELTAEAGGSKARLLEALEHRLVERRARGEVVALVVDEAQRLSSELLEEIRLLGNIETTSDKLLPLVLAGQRELAERLEEPALRQLKQRVCLRCEVAPLQLQETASYIASRIVAAGGVPSRLFTKEAIAAIHQHSDGIPRTINVVCDNALVTGMALDRQPVDAAVVLEVCRDFALNRTTVSGTSSALPGAASDAEGNAMHPSAPGHPDEATLFGFMSRPRRRFLFRRGGRRG